MSPFRLFKPLNFLHGPTMVANIFSHLGPPNYFSAATALVISQKKNINHNSKQQVLQEWVNSILLSNFIEINFCYGCSPVNLLHFFRTPFPKNTSGLRGLSFTDLYSFKDSFILQVLHKNFKTLA